MTAFFERKAAWLCDFLRLCIMLYIQNSGEEAVASKVIDKPLEAEVVLHLSEEDKNLLTWAFGTNVHQWLKVSKVTFTDEELTKYLNAEVKIVKAEGVVCPRCWNITDSKREDCLCERCVKVLKL